MKLYVDYIDSDAEVDKIDGAKSEELVLVCSVYRNISETD